MSVSFLSKFTILSCSSWKHPIYNIYTCGRIIRDNRRDTPFAGASHWDPAIWVGYRVLIGLVERYLCAVEPQITYLTGTNLSQ